MRGPFNPEMLAIARDAREFTQGALIDRLREPMSQGKLSKIENGLIAPSDEDVAALAAALGVRTEFFFHPYVRRAAPPTYHRKRVKLPKGDWERIYATAEIYRMTAGLMLKSLELTPSRPTPPAIDPDEHDGRVQEIAVAIRQLWALPRGPVADVTALLESAGLVIVLFDFGTDLCDGFCQHAADGVPPIIFANSRQPKDKLRYSLAHELGHIVLHRLPNPDMEQQANTFAAEFLMPTADITKDFYSLSLEKFMTLKRYWKTSMQALMFKARDVGRISESAFRYYMMNLSKRGWRTKEPVEIEVQESPRLLGQLVRNHMGRLGYSLDDLSCLTGLTHDEFQKLYGLATTPKLRLIV
jgi:Zn-dependent peptidase ImmA (M78 family)